VDKRRVDRSRVRLAEVEIGDETGTVSLRARDEQIDLLDNVSRGKTGAVVLRNCTLELYQGKHIRLAVTKWGKLAEYPDNVASTPRAPSTMNIDRTFSLIDLSVLASEIIERSSTESTTQYITSTRYTKPPDGESNSSSRTSSTKLSGQSSRRSSKLSNERRQSRSANYGGVKKGTNKFNPKSQILYHGNQGYHGYEQIMDMRMRQYTHSYPHSSRQVSAQLALQQQHEMQQRQFRQLYSREQNRHSSQMLLHPVESFETPPISYSEDIGEQQRHQLMPGLGIGPILMPMRMTCGSEIDITSLPPEHYSSSNLESLNTRQDSSHSSLPPSNEVAPFPIGKMNPEAMSFAPSYLNVASRQGKLKSKDSRYS